MDQLFEFIGNHPFLVGTFVLLLVLFIRNETQRGGRSVSAQELVGLVNKEDAVVLDLRDKKEFEAGHIVDTTGTFQGNGIHPGFEFGLGKFLRHFGSDKSGSNSVHSHASWSQFFCHSFSKSNHTGFSRTVVCLSWISHLPCNRSNINNAPRTLLEHQLTHSTSAIKDACQVEINNRIPIFGLHS